MCATMQKLRIWSSFKRGLVTEERRRPWSGRPVKPGRACGHENCRRKGATRVGPHRRTWSHALAKYSGHKKGSSGYFGRTPEKNRAPIWRAVSLTMLTMTTASSSLRSSRRAPALEPAHCAPEQSEAIRCGVHSALARHGNPRCAETNRCDYLHRLCAQTLARRDCRRYCSKKSSPTRGSPRHASESRVRQRLALPDRCAGSRSSAESSVATRSLSRYRSRVPDRADQRSVHPRRSAQDADTGYPNSPPRCRRFPASADFRLDEDDGRRSLHFPDWPARGTRANRSAPLVDREE